jgi:hypothetical protein
MATVAQETGHHTFVGHLHHKLKDSPSRLCPHEGLTDFLDKVYDELSWTEIGPMEVARSLGELILLLEARKSLATEEEWQAVVSACRAHRVMHLLHQDPFTRRAFVKPRGYAGDAVLMDYIYGREEQWPRPDATRLGQLIFDFTTSSPAPEGVRARRGVIADLVDRLAEHNTHPHVLSVAAGHFREANLSAAVRRRKFGRYVALDNDSVSLEEVDRCYGFYGVETVHASIRKLLTNRLNLGHFHFIYATGLFDYLRPPIAQRLVANLFGMLYQHGRLLVANFLPGIRDVGYMEVYMDWQLIYRTRYEMMDLTREVPQNQIGAINVFAEENQNIVFLEMTRR